MPQVKPSYVAERENSAIYKSLEKYFQDFKIYWRFEEFIENLFLSSPEYGRKYVNILDDMSRRLTREIDKVKHIHARHVHSVEHATVTWRVYDKKQYARNVRVGEYHTWNQLIASKIRQWRNEAMKWRCQKLYGMILLRGAAIRRE